MSSKRDCTSVAFFAPTTFNVSPGVRVQGIMEIFVLTRIEGPISLSNHCNSVGFKPSRVSRLSKVSKRSRLKFIVPSGTRRSNPTSPPPQKKKNVFLSLREVDNSFGRFHCRSDGENHFPRTLQIHPSDCYTVRIRIAYVRYGTINLYLKYTQIFLFIYKNGFPSVCLAFMHS
jgi:hypothetical protein